MEKTIMTSAGAAYEPPFAEIIEFAVEEGFNGSGGYDSNEGTESLDRENVTDPWY